MSTPAYIHVIDDCVTIATLYVQCDGYPSETGKNIKDAIEHLTIVDGLTRGETNEANGMGCLAAQLIAKLKTGPGGLYVEEPGVSCDEDYNYYIERGTPPGDGPGNDPVWLRLKKRGTTLFDNTLGSFNPHFEDEDDGE